MNNLFNTIIKERQFNFQPLEFGNVAAYNVDVKDEQGTRWEFRMYREGEGWKMKGEKLPGWISEAEPEVSIAINQHD